MEFVAKNGIKVVMNGQGADESFYGYTRNLFGYYLLDSLEISNY
jgi:asparagine synthetase B (glutamine-hydrolysing)